MAHMAVEPAGGTGQRLRAASVGAIRGLVAACSAALAAMAAHKGPAKVALEAILCAVLVGVVDTAITELLHFDDQLMSWRGLRRASEMMISYVAGGAVPLLSVLAPAAGRLAAVLVSSAVALAACGMAREAGAGRSRARLLWSAVRAVVLGSAATGVIFLILDHVAKLFQTENLA